MGKEPVVRWNILFWGRVQGVGFRWRARQAAEHYGLTGWVRNLDDGNVEMEVQGRGEDIYKLIAAINKSRYIQIEDYRITKRTPDPGESRFRVTGYY